MGAVNGHEVVVRVKDFGNKRKNPEGEVVEILGHINDPGIDILSIMAKYDINDTFSDKVILEIIR